MTLDTYGHVIDEIESTERRPADVVIREAPESIASRGSGSIRQA
jgi:hypothetical protein